MEPMTEAQFTKRLMQYGRDNGWLCFHVFATGPKSVSCHGFPDMIFLKDGKLVVAELKRDKPNKTYPDKRQREWLQAFVDAGIPTYTWRPDDLDQIVEVLV